MKSYQFLIHSGKKVVHHQWHVKQEQQHTNREQSFNYLKMLPTSQQKTGYKKMSSHNVLISLKPRSPNEGLSNPPPRWVTQLLLWTQH